MAEPESWTDRLPDVIPSSGLVLVLTGATRILARLTWSSSAATCARAVQMPWPYSTLPDLMVTWPALPKSSHRASTGLAARLAGSAVGAGPPGCGRAGDEAPPARDSSPACAGGGHGVCPAAVRTALTIRPWLPHRHRLPSSASRTSAAAGAGFRWSKSTALITMPAVQ